jgi:hypothetical protein
MIMITRGGYWFSRRQDDSGTTDLQSVYRDSEPLEVVLAQLNTKKPVHRVIRITNRPKGDCYARIRMSHVR